MPPGRFEAEGEPGPPSADVDADVVIVGLGPVGAVLAALLGAAGVEVVVLDTRADVTPFPRAIAADGETLRTLLDVLGPAGRDLFLLDRSVQVRGGARGLITSIAFPPVDDARRNPIAQPGLSFFFQPALERALRARLGELASVRLRPGAAVRAIRDEPGRVAAVLDDGEVVRARWIVGCDGATSVVRRARGIAYAGRTVAQPWLVVDLDSPRPLPGLDAFRYVIDPSRPAVSMPRPGGHRVEFMLRPGESAEALAEPSVLGALLGTHLGAPLPDDVRVIRAAGYVFHARTAQRWRDGRVLLAGDAAHSMPPFGGQGMGAGIADAAALSWRLAEVCRGLSPPAVLDAYEREQRPRVEAMSRAALTIGRLLTPGSRSAAVAVRAALRAASAAPVLGPRFRSGALRADVTPAVPAEERTLAGGVPLPNPRVRTTPGRVVRLDDVLGRQWAVLQREEAAPLDRAAEAALAARGARRYAVGSGGLTDLDGSLTRLWDDDRTRVLLVRPDRVVAALGSPRQVDTVLARLTGRRG